MSELQFQPFPKMARLTRECVITEKIDGTNAQVNIVPRCSCTFASPFESAGMACGNCNTKQFIIAQNDEFVMFAGSRTRYVTPGKEDNYGFAAWVTANANDLFNLGPGRHFGEWWGSKIQRGYGRTYKTFSLFNTSRWKDCYQNDDTLLPGQQIAPACCSVVPELYRGMFSENVVNGLLTILGSQGSQAAPGFMQPEGIVIYHTHAGTMFKKTLKDDAVPKSSVKEAA